ncbi:MAG: polysaccharide deacetylase family protein [Spirochaetes bacterium]|nr:MAG: polysaccharide deacetylase family protein [Spirochaetota bacterium]
MKPFVFICIVILLVLSSGVYSEVTFSGLHLSDKNTLLFEAETYSPGIGKYRTLFFASADNWKLHQLTFFPERMALVQGKEQLQIQNRFGVFRSDKNLKKITPVEKFPAFTLGRQIDTGKINPVEASPDGNYLLYVKPKSYAYGDLLLFDVQNQKDILITSGVELSLRGPNARWGPNSRFFIYQKEGYLYYFSIDHMSTDRILTEKLRTIGEGKIANVYWNRDGSLFYVIDTLVYQIFSAEFFTRSIYADLLNIGRIVGKLPFSFDPNFDSFWVSPDGVKIMFDKGGRNIFIYFLDPDDYLTTGKTQSLPYLFLPRNTRIKRVIWSSSDRITLLTSSIINGESETTVFRVDLTEEDSPPFFKATGDSGVRDMVLSPNQLRAAVVKEEGVVIKKYNTWEDEFAFPHPDPLSALWRANDELIIGGKYFIERADLLDKSSKIITLSQPEDYGFGKKDDKIQVKVKEKVFNISPADGTMEHIDSFSVKEQKLFSKNYRVYLEKSTAGSYENIVMVRNIDKLITQPLFKPPETRYEPFPEKEEQIDFINFSHGSRIRRREVALVFNAMDTIEGLTEVLNTLSEYNLKATFFVNGEFIRRHPGAVKEIARSGHEVGSLFFAYFNITDSRYKVDKDFVKRGLARNEDEYFQTTGRELSLFWHAPLYFVNTEIIEAAREMNYLYVGRDIDILDWVTEEQARDMPGTYMPAAKLVERVLKLKKPGSIIPIRIGRPSGKRADYLFSKLDLLINGLISIGYKIVPVSTLVEHAK